MSLPQRDRTRYNSKFRFKRNPKISFMGFIGEPPTQVRYDNNPPQMLEVGFGVQDLTGKLIEHCDVRKTLYFVGSFLDLTQRINYRVYEVTSYVTLQRDIITIHPVTKQKINSGTYTENVWIQEEPIESRPETGINPVQEFNLRLDVPVYERDLIGNYLVRNVYKENGLWLAQCEYKVKALDLANSLILTQDSEILELQTGESIQFMENYDA